MRLGVNDVRRDAANIPVEGVRMLVCVSEVPFRRFGDRVKAMEGKWVLPVLHPCQGWWFSATEWKEAVEAIALLPVPAVELVNEPQKVHWPRYWDLVRRASPILRAAGKQVVLGGCPPAWAQAFLRAAHEAGVLPLCDGIGLHPYLLDPNRQRTWTADRRAQLDGYGCTAPLHLTEFGWETPLEQYLPSPMEVTEAQQAAFLTRAFTGLQAASAFWFSWRDFQGKRYRPYTYGLRRLDGSPKPSLAALTDL